MTTKSLNRTSSLALRAPKGPLDVVLDFSQLALAIVIFRWSFSKVYIYICINIQPACKNTLNKLFGFHKIIQKNFPRIQANVQPMFGRHVFPKINCGPKCADLDATKSRGLEGGKRFGETRRWARNHLGWFKNDWTMIGTNRKGAVVSNFFADCGLCMTLLILKNVFVNGWGAEKPTRAASVTSRLACAWDSLLAQAWLKKPNSAGKSTEHPASAKRRIRCDAERAGQIPGEKMVILKRGSSQIKSVSNYQVSNQEMEKNDVMIWMINVQLTCHAIKSSIWWSITMSSSVPSRAYGLVQLGVLPQQFFGLGSSLFQTIHLQGDGKTAVFRPVSGGCRFAPPHLPVAPGLLPFLLVAARWLQPLFPGPFSAPWLSKQPGSRPTVIWVMISPTGSAVPLRRDNPGGPSTTMPKWSLNHPIWRPNNQQFKAKPLISSPQLVGCGAAITSNWPVSGRAVCANAGVAHPTGIAPTQSGLSHGARCGGQHWERSGEKKKKTSRANSTLTSTRAKSKHTSIAVLFLFVLQT